MKARTHNIGFCASVAGQTNISQLQIQAVVRAGQSMNSLPSQILERCVQPYLTTPII
jgi:hypothetical protein